MSDYVVCCFVNIILLQKINTIPSYTLPSTAAEFKLNILIIDPIMRDMKSHGFFAAIYYIAMPCLRFPGYVFVSSRAFFHSFLKHVFKTILYRRWSEIIKS